MTSPSPSPYSALDNWIDAHFDAEVAFLQKIVQVPTDTPPGNNTPHAQRTAGLLKEFGFDAEQHTVPAAVVRDAGLQSITNLVVRRPYGPGRTVALNAHGDVVPPGEGWTHPPYGGELGPGWLLAQGLVKPDLLIAAGFSYQVVTAHNGCLQMEVTVNGKMGHAAVPETGVDALQAATLILSALYHQNTLYKQLRSQVQGITHPYLNVGLIEGGTNTNVVPGKVVLKFDRRMIPEENPAEVEAGLRQLIAAIVADCPGITIGIRRLLLANALQPLPGNQPMVDALSRHASAVFDEAIGATGTPLYTDARLFGEHGIPAVLYGCGPRTVSESNAKRADEHIELQDLRRATKVVARTLFDLLA